VFNSSNFRIERVGFVFYVRSGTGLAYKFEGGCLDCLEISKYFFCVRMEILKRKMVLGKSKIFINLCSNVIINSYYNDYFIIT